MPASDENVDLQGLVQQVHELGKVVAQLTELTRNLARAVSHAPVHLEVEHLQIERVEFNLEGIDVEELGGELNIGITVIHKPRETRHEQPIWPVHRKGGEHGKTAAEPDADSGGDGRVAARGPVAFRE